MKSVLVTGATGFIGRHTIAPLLKKNFKVHATYSTRKPLEGLDVTWHQVNLLDNAAVESLLLEIMPTHLLHLAWYTKPKEYWTSPHNLMWLNSSAYLLKTFIKTKGQRAVFAGTCAEYDWESGVCEEHSTPCTPESVYGVSKQSLYSQSEEMAKEHGLSFAWARIFFLFGAHEYPERLIPSAINGLLKNKTFEVTNGYQVRDFMCVEDVADALVALLDSDVKGPVNIGSGKAISIRELISSIAAQLSLADGVEFRDPLNKAKDEVVADVTRLQTEVKWRPSYSLEDALKNCIAWWKGRPAK